MTTLPNRRDIEFKTYEGDTLRGWFYPSNEKAPVIIMAHGLGGLKEHFLDDFAAEFQAAGFATLVATLTPEVDPSRIAIWGSSYSGGNDLVASAVNTRVKAVISQVPFTSGEAVLPLFPPGVVEAMYANRTYGVDSEYVPLFVDSLEVAKAEGGPKPILGSVEAFEYWEDAKARSAKAGSEWEIKISLQTFYHMTKNEPVNFIHRIAPRPLLYVVAMSDSMLSTERALGAYEKAGEGKELLKLDGGHFAAYRGEGFKVNIKRQIEFLKKHL